MAKGKSAALYRVAKFEIHPSPEQLRALQRVSDNLWLVWNEALSERQALFNAHIAPLYEELKTANKAQDEQRTKTLREQLKAAYRTHSVTLFDQINALTERRKKDAFGQIPRNWQEETLDTLDGAYKSFLALRKNGDYDARPPKMRSPHGFWEISGRLGFKIDGGVFSLSTTHVPHGVALSFAIPTYQQAQLARAKKVKKFTLYRTPHDTREPGRFWVSVAFEIEAAAQRPFSAENAAYVWLGASSLGITSPNGETVIDWWRPDKYWKPRIESVSKRMDRCTRGSRRWKKLNEARRRMFRLMAEQQKINHREVAKRVLAKYGVHLIVNNVVVRSKEGKLADSSVAERSGSLGLNWSAQNTGSLAAFVAWLTIKAQENGGSVRKHPFTPRPTELGSRERKILFARALRDDFLKTQGS